MHGKLLHWHPFEDGKVTVSRAAGSMTFPAEFMLVAAMNPCPCGYYGDPRRECRCGTNAVQKYRQRISGPLLDRIDLHIEVPAVPFKELSSGHGGTSSADMRASVVRAREIQRARFAGSQTRANGKMTHRQTRQYCQLDEAGMNLLRGTMTELGLSARAHDKILRVARTIADLDASPGIQPQHVNEAINYRMLDRSLWT